MGTTANWNATSAGSLLHLIIAVESWMPYVKVEVDPYDKTVSLAGGCMKPVLDVLMQAAQASYELVVPAERGNWGTKQENGSWTGIIGLLAHKKADIGLGPFADTYERHKVVEFGGMVDFTDIKILTKYSTTETAASNQQDMLLKLKGTDWKVFASLLLCWCFLPLMCMAIDKNFTEFRYYFEFIGAFFEQGVWVVSPNTGIRIILVSFWLAATVLSTYINGHLHSSMVVQSNVKLIDSFEELHKAVKSSGLCPVFEFASATTDYFRDAGSSYLGDLLKRSKSCNGLLSGLHDTHFAKRFNEEDMAIVQADVTMMSQSRLFCDAYPKLHLHLSSEGTFPSTLGFLVTKKLNPYLKRILSRNAWAIFESGLMSKWMKAAQAEVPCLTSSISGVADNSQEMQANLNVFRGVFRVWGVGLAQSGLALCIEMVIFHIKCRRSKAFKKTVKMNT